MTLREKFKDADLKVTCYADFEINYEKIVDEIAIGFADWMAKEYWLNSSGKYTQGQTHEELLKIYKREKGLLSE